jgi:hypothetical protein
LVDRARGRAGFDAIGLAKPAVAAAPTAVALAPVAFAAWPIAVVAAALASLQAALSTQATFGRNRSLYVLAGAASCSCKLQLVLQVPQEKSRFHKEEPRNENGQPLSRQEKFYGAPAYLP